MLRDAGLTTDPFLYYGKLFAALAAQLGLNLDPVTALFFGLFAIFFGMVRAAVYRFRA